MENKRFAVFPSGQYLQIRCMEHPEAFARMQFVENDGAVSVVEITCPECGSTGPLKCDQFTISNEWTKALVAMGETRNLPKN